MKKAPASTSSPGATEACASCSEFAFQCSTQCGTARRSTLGVVSPRLDDHGLRRLARIAMQLRWLFGSDFVRDGRSSQAIHDLIDALESLAGGGFDDIEAQTFEGVAAELLNDLIASVTSGFGEFEAHFSIDGTVTFVDEPDAVSQGLLQLDHRKNVRRRRLQPDLPRYRIEVRFTGKRFDCWSLNGALHVLQQAKTAAIETFCVEAQARCDARRGGAV